MGKVPAPSIQWRGAHPNNFTVGRQGVSRDGRNTSHHVVGSAESAVLVFNQPNRGASSHFVITDRADVQVFQCVNLNDTAWCDGNWESNLRTISMEHHGDWRNGYRNQQVINNAAHLVAWLRENYGVTRPIRHRDVSLTGTICPADLPVEEIWNKATEIIKQYNQPVTPPAPEWQRNRAGIPQKTVYAQAAGFFLRNLNDPNQPADARRFPLNQDFVVAGKTTVGGQEYYITKSSMDLNLPNGLKVSEVADKPWAPPVVIPPAPTTTAWADSVVDDENRTLYVLRATPLIDLENGHPVMKDGKEVWYSAGDIIENVSAHTIVSEVTYQLTEYSFGQIEAGKWQNANGIKSSDLTTDPEACPVGTPANPSNPPEPTDPPEDMPDVPTPHDEEQDKRLSAIEALLQKVVDFIKSIFKNF